MLRILHVIGNLKHDDTGIFLTELLPALSNAGLSVGLAVIDKVDPRIVDRMRASAIEIICFDAGFAAPLHNVCILRRLAANYDIVHSHDASSRLYTAICMPKKCRHVTTIEERWRDIHGLRRFADHMALWRCRAVICDDSEVRSCLIKNCGVSEDRIHIVISGVNLKSMCRPRHIPTSVNHNLLVLTDFSDMQALRTVFAALRCLPADYSLTVMSDDYPKPYARLAAQRFSVKERVRFVGQSNDRMALYKTSDVVIDTHYGLTRVLLEAIASGRPVLVDDIRIRYIQEEFTDSLPRYEQGSYRSLADAIIGLECDAWRYGEYNERARYAVDSYDINRTALSYAAVYRCVSRSQND